MTKHSSNLIGKLAFVVVATAAAASAPAPAASASAPTPAQLLPDAVEAQMNDLAVAGDSLVAVGERGIIIRSQDGEHWTQMPSPVRAMLNSVHFVDDRHGWAVGHNASILHTEDGGKSWSLQTYGEGDGDPYMDVLFTDARTGYAIGAYGLFKVTEDGGKTWEDLSDPVLTELALHMNALLRLGDGTFVMVGERGLVATSPDGRSWEKLEAPYDGSFYAALPIGERGLLAVGMRGNAFQIEEVPIQVEEQAVQAEAGSPQPEAPSQWQQLQMGTVQSIYAVARLDDGRILTAGNDGTLIVLERGKAPAPLPLPEDSVEKSESAGLATKEPAFIALLYWKGDLYAATSDGMQRIAVSRSRP